MQRQRQRRSLIRNVMPELRLAFFRGRTWSIRSWAIRLWTLSHVNHVEVLAPDGRALSADVSRGVIWYPFSGDPSAWELYTLPVTAAQLAQVEAFAAAELGCAYDWRGIFLAQLLPFRREDPERWFCSELSAAVLQQLGHLPGRRACSFSPAALRDAVRQLPNASRLG